MYAVRYPVVLGRDDYTKRLYFYVENILKNIPMYIDNLSAQMCYINSSDAGLFLSFLADKNFSGAISGCSKGTISISEIINYVEQKTGKKAILDINGIPAPYNNEVEFSINTDKANALGFEFSHINDWIYQLLVFYIDNHV